jgi:DNA-binding transcriptional ArsR family regulator
MAHPVRSPCGSPAARAVRPDSGAVGAGRQQFFTDQTGEKSCDGKVPDAPAAPDRLARLLGPTRAALLYETATRGFASTSALAGTVVVSVPSASRQLGVLREAGLVTSRRDGKYVLHSVTPLGLRLLGNRTGAAAEEPS